MTQAELETILQEGEGYSIEFKENANSDLSKEMVAYANSSGGRIFIGIDDNNTLKGVPINNTLKSKTQTIARDCDPSVEISLEVYKNILIIYVPEGSEKPYRCNKGFFIRSGANSQKMGTRQIIDFVQQEGRIKFDEQTKVKIDYKKLYKPELLNRFLKIANIPQIMEDEDILRNLGILDNNNNYLNNAGILFYTEKPADILMHSIVTCVLYKGTEKINILDRKDINTDFLNTINEAITFLKKHLNLSYKIESTQRQEILEIPEVALREAVINAVAHRDYFEEGANVIIEIFDDRVDISNPGGLPKSLTPKNFGKKSIARNPLIANLFHRAKFIEKLGTGINRIKNALKEAGLPEPEFEFTGFFSITFKRIKVDKTVEKTVEKTRDMILRIIMENSEITALELSDKLEITSRAIEKSINQLKNEGILIRKGSKKTGYWEIKSSE